MRIRRVHLLLLLLAMALAAIPFRQHVRRAFFSALQIVKGRKTVAEQVARYEAPVRARLEADVRAAGTEWPPARLTLIGLKHERRLEAWVAGKAGPFRLLKTYPILGASGTLGPKLAEGDNQVPEGRYRVESLNPNSAFHLALRVGYPNEFDRAMGARDGRTQLGGDIMIHGSTASIGCLAMGDPAAEELFVLAARAGLENVNVLIAPVDFRRRDLPGNLPSLPPWSATLFAELRQVLAAFPLSPEPAPAPPSPGAVSTSSPASKPAPAPVTPPR